MQQKKELMAILKRLGVPHQKIVRSGESHMATLEDGLVCSSIWVSSDAEVKVVERAMQVGVFPLESLQNDSGYKAFVDRVAPLTEGYLTVSGYTSK